MGIVSLNVRADMDGPNAAHEQAAAVEDLQSVATTHVIARVKPGIAPVQRQGRWTFGIREGEEPARFPDPAQRAAVRNASRDVTDLLEARGVQSIASPRVRPQNEQLAQQLGLDRYFRIDVPPGTNTKALAAELGDFRALFESVEVDGIGGVAGTVPSDPEFGLQYALHNTGQVIGGVAGVPGADINALAAWDLATGSNDIVIAVVDSGVNAHSDLRGRLLPGYSVFPPDHSDSSDQCVSHGTHVSGIIAANVDNAAYTAGLTWQSKILPVRVLNGCSGNEQNAADGVIYAADAGADIINMSLQYGIGSSYFHNAIIYAKESGAIIVAAAGNNNAFSVCNGSTCVAFPARWPETIAVAATNNKDERWVSNVATNLGSNMGPELNVAAPGKSIRSIIGTSSTEYKDGTSFASPLVAGTIALMLSIDPDLTFDEVVDILEQTAADVGPPGFDEEVGHGRIDAHAALVEVIGPVPGDLDGSGTVDVFDLLLLLGLWGPCGDCGDCPADLVPNCTVDVFDLLDLLGKWG